MAGRDLTITVTWWVIPLPLGTTLKSTANLWMQGWWRLTALKRTSLSWIWSRRKLHHYNRFGSGWNGLQTISIGTITRFQSTLTGLLMNPMEKRKSHAVRCGWMDTHRFPSDQLVIGMTFHVMWSQAFQMALSARGFPNWQANWVKAAIRHRWWTWYSFKEKKNSDSI